LAQPSRRRCPVFTCVTGQCNWTSCGVDIKLDVTQRKASMQKRIKNILSNLKNVQEDLLALSDDLWLEIDHNDNDAIKSGVAFKASFNECNASFTLSANNLSELIQKYTNTPLYTQDKAPEQRLPADRAEHDRIIKELDKKEPHMLEEDFRYKRPFGFVIQGVPYKNKITWSELYLQLCSHLQTLNPDKFAALDSDPDHISNRNNKYFSKRPGDLRGAQKCGPSLYAEMNLSANQIRDSIKRLLATFEISRQELTIYLREDRDA
jgi:hypothetical protein